MSDVGSTRTQDCDGPPAAQLHAARSQATRSPARRSQVERPGEGNVSSVGLQSIVGWRRFGRGLCVMAAFFCASLAAADPGDVRDHASAAIRNDVAVAPTAGLSAAERQRVVDQIDTVGRRGFLYEVSGPSNTTDATKHLYLYGTIHLGRVGSEPFNLPVVKALRQSRRLALEADPTDDATTRRLALQLGRYPDGDDLRRHVPAALMARVLAFGERNGLAAGDIARFKPWLLANMVTLRDFGDVGLDPALGSELYLSGFARARHMPIVEIEGIEAQLRLLSSLPDALQAAQLEEALQDLDDHGATDGSEGHDGKALFDLWLNGDAQAGDALVADLHREEAGKPFNRYFVETLIDRRDRIMADKAESYFALPGNTFIAVGALHLFGPAGLLAEMRRRGYRVVDLQERLDVAR